MGPVIGASGIAEDSKRPASSGSALIIKESKQADYKDPEHKNETKICQNAALCGSCPSRRRTLCRAASVLSVVSTRSRAYIHLSSLWVLILVGLGIGVAIAVLRSSPEYEFVDPEALEEDASSAAQEQRAPVFIGVEQLQHLMAGPSSVTVLDARPSGGVASVLDPSWTKTIPGRKDKLHVFRKSMHQSIHSFIHPSTHP
eukprot:scaffold108116_cov17-Prasinocladus_malaysianus.AAC.3